MKYHKHILACKNLGSYILAMKFVALHGNLDSYLTSFKVTFLYSY